jgi:hypothetical protein
VQYNQTAMERRRCREPENQPKPVDAIICWPVDKEVSGATITHCSQCLTKVWIANETRRLATGPVLCVDCAMKRIKDQDEVTLLSRNGEIVAKRDPNR